MKEKCKEYKVEGEEGGGRWKKMKGREREGEGERHHPSYKLPFSISQGKPQDCMETRL